MQKETRERKVQLGRLGRATAANIRRLRSERGLTLQQLADRSRDAGKSFSVDALSKIENEQRRVDVDDLGALATLLSTTLDDLVYGNHGRAQLNEIRDNRGRLQEVAEFQKYLLARQGVLEAEIGQKYESGLAQELGSIDIFEPDVNDTLLKTTGERAASIATGHSVTAAKKLNPAQSEPGIVSAVQKESDSAALIIAIEKEKAPDRAPGADAPPS